GAATPPLTAPAPATATARAIDDAPCVTHIKENHTYTANNATYRTDHYGRPYLARVVGLKARKEDRGDCQKDMRLWIGANYDSGHLIAASLQGPDRRYNLVPQWNNLNRKTYRILEVKAAACVRDYGGSIPEYIVQVNYPSTGADIYPVSFTLSMRIEKNGKGQTYTENFANRELGDDETAAIRDRIDRSFRAVLCDRR
ncbi:DNA/RNA non-specific endonuclease, partial [Streptosporangium algeriense]